MISHSCGWILLVNMFCLDPILGTYYCWASWPQAFTNSWIVAIFTRIVRCLPSTASGYLFIMSMVPVLARLPDRANRKSDSPLNMGRIRVKEDYQIIGNYRNSCNKSSSAKYIVLKVIWFLYNVQNVLTIGKMIFFLFFFFKIRFEESRLFCRERSIR